MVPADSVTVVGSTSSLIGSMLLILRNMSCLLDICLSVNSFLLLSWSVSSELFGYFPLALWSDGIVRAMIREWWLSVYSCMFSLHRFQLPRDHLKSPWIFEPPVAVSFDENLALVSCLSSFGSCFKARTVLRLVKTSFTHSFLLISKECYLFG